MKRIFLICFLVMCATVSKAQYPLIQNLASDSTLVRIGATYSGGMKGLFVNRAFTDTTQANTYRIKAYEGAQIFTSGDSSIWVRGTGATKWIKQFSNTSGAGGDTLVWKLSGNTVGSRVATPVLGTLDGNDLNIITDGALRFSVPSGGIVYNLAPSTVALRYDTITKQMYHGDAGGSGSGWSLTGNSGTTVGTNFVGTTDNQDLSFKTNSVQRMRLFRDSLYMYNNDGTARLKFNFPVTGVNDASKITFVNPDGAEMLIQSGDEYLETLTGWYIRNSVGYNVALSVNGALTGQTQPLMQVTQNGNDSIFTILPSGNVGVGTNTPLSKLHVEGGFFSGYYDGTSTVNVGVRAAAIGSATDGKTTATGEAVLVVGFSQDNDADVSATGTGGISMGYANDGSKILNEGSGSFVGGIALTGPSLIRGTGEGTFTWGALTNTPGLVDTVENTGVGSFVAGNGASGSLYNTGVNSFVFGSGYTNSISNVFSIGYGSSQFILDGATGNVGVGANTPDSLLTVGQGIWGKRGVRFSGLPTGIPASAKRILMAADGTFYAADTTTSGASGLTVGTTTITSGTNTRILYNNSGVLGEYSVTGSGTTAVLSTSPTFTTGITTPLISMTSSNTTQTTTSSALALGFNSGTTGTGIYAASSSLSSGKMIDVAVTGTAGATGQVGINVNLSGANSSSSQTTYGLRVTNAHTGTTPKNWSVYTDAGNVGLGSPTNTNSNGTLIVRQPADGASNFGIKVLTNNELAGLEIAYDKVEYAGILKLVSTSGGVEVIAPSGTGLNIGASAAAPTSTLTVDGSTGLKYTGTATSLNAGVHTSIAVTATGQTITLPTAVGITGRVYIIKLTASGTGTVATTSSQTIDGSTTYSLSAQYKYVWVQSDGANWNIISNN